MRGAAALARTALLIGLAAGCAVQAAAAPGTGAIDPRAYDAFCLWPGVRLLPGAHPATLYLLDGEVRRVGQPHLARLRAGVPRLAGPALWLVVRSERLDWGAATLPALIGDLERWQRAGNRMVGLQVDFDAPTRGIARYVQFLRQLRAQLPPRWRLSVTGLMDWGAHGDPAALADLRRIVDEVVIQTYQGRQTIRGITDYLNELTGFPIPFRIALVDGGQWAGAAVLERLPLFRGYVVFMLPRRSGLDSTRKP